MWHLTVAAVIVDQGRFLFVEEIDDPEIGPVLNQPAGHVEADEHPLDAVVREVLEETGLHFRATHFLGIYPLRIDAGTQYLRLAFLGEVDLRPDAKPLDPEILRCLWLRPEELAGRPLRSPLVRAVLDDALAGVRLPLAQVHPFMEKRSA